MSTAARPQGEPGPKGASPGDGPEADTHMMRRPRNRKEAEA